MSRYTRPCLLLLGSASLGALACFVPGTTIAIPTVGDLMAVIPPDQGMVDPGDLDPDDLDDIVILSPASTIPEGHFYSERIHSQTRIAVAGVTTLDEESDHAIVSISFDADGWPLNWDDALDQDVPVYVGYTEEIGGILWTVTSIDQRGPEVGIGYDVEIPVLGLSGWGRDAYRYDPDDPDGALYVETSFYATGGDTEMAGGSSGWADGPYPI